MTAPIIEPLVEEVVEAPSSETVFSRLSGLPHCVFLDSAMEHPRLGRYSFVAADPFGYLEVAADQDAFGPLEAVMLRFKTRTIPGLPPFQGGAAGVLGYDLGRQLERIARPRLDEFGVPVLAVGLYDVVVAFDHQEQRVWVFSSGLPEQDRLARTGRARTRLERFKRYVLGKKRVDVRVAGLPVSAKRPLVETGELAVQFPTAHLPRLTSNFCRDGYLNAVRRVIDYILAGDVFQVNLSQRLLHPALDDSPALYRRLRRRNAAPFAGYFDLGEFQILSASPERFLQVADRRVETRPIKGTCPRADQRIADDRQVAHLRASEKDQAENVMIVDLLRNDLSRVCRADSVQVTELCSLERYPYVHHLVSAVRGQLGDGKSCVDLVRETFPGGSITGAPKIRAMEIIAELEPTARGPYCGSLGYLGFDGSMDLSILIRTITAGRGWWQAPVGGGIVAQSSPEAEYDETWHKAEGIVRALLP